jgi:seryl-tRNA synthetase
MRGDKMEDKYVEKILETEQRSKSNTHRIDEHDEQIKELSNVYVALTKTNDKVDKIESDVTEMKGDLKEIKEKPSKKMDQMWGYIVGGLIGAIITFLAIKLGLK